MEYDEPTTGERSIILYSLQITDELTKPNIKMAAKSVFNMILEKRLEKANWAKQKSN